MAAAAAALLDELMGRNRNAAPHEKGIELNWEDPEVKTVRYLLNSNFYKFSIFTFVNYTSISFARTYVDSFYTCKYK